jgi:hypothetical protein
MFNKLKLKRLVPLYLQHWMLFEMLECLEAQSSSLSKLAQAVSVLTCIPEVLGFNFGWDTNYPVRFFMVYIAPPGKIQNNIFKLGHDNFLSHRLQFVIHNHPIILCCILWVTDSVIRLTTNLNLDHMGFKSHNSELVTGFSLEVFFD